MNISSTNNMMEISKIHQQLTTGKRINSASDDASGMAINEKIIAEANGYDKGIDNSKDMQNLMKTAEGGLSIISDSLQRIRELGVQASSGIYNDSDKAIMQEEVKGLLEVIKDSAKGTEYNSIKLLDGNFADKNTASNPSGNGMKISIGNSTLESLGIEEFDLTKDFDLDSIDNALKKVNDSRSKIGAQYNRLEHTINSNEITSINMKEASSRIADTDMAKAVTQMHAENVKQQYQVAMQKDQMQRVGAEISLLG